MVDALGGLAPNTEKEAFPALTRIATHGIEAGVHFIAAAQAPLSEMLSGLINCRGMVEVAPVESVITAGEMVTGRFQFASKVDVNVADIAWLSLRDLDTAARLAAAGWRAIGFSAQYSIGI